MRYLSVCSGIEAASVAWHQLGWEPVGFSEIEPFPSAVLAHRFPAVPNYGDMTKFQEWPIEPGTIDILVGGTPCQSFSVAGLRKGLEDPRGGLMLTYLEIARHLRPRWVVWENVPGVLSSNGGRDFGSFLGALGDMGYWWAFRVLDAQWVRTQRHPHAVPQRRRRVFVVGCLGDWTAAAKVLFERESVQRDSAKGRAAREEAPGDAGGCAATVCSKWSKGTGGPSGNECGNLTLQPVANTLDNRGLRSHTELDGHGAYVPVPFTKSKRAQSTTDDETWVEGQVNPTLSLFDQGDTRATTVAVAFPIQDGREIDKAQNGLGVGAPSDPGYTVDTTGAQAVAFNWQNGGGYGNANEGLGITIEGTGPLQRCNTPAVAFQQNTRDEVRLMNGDGAIAGALAAEAGMKQQNYVAHAAVAFPIDTQNMTEGHQSGGLGFGQQDDPSFTLSKGHSHAVAFQQNQVGEVRTGEVAGTVNTNSNPSGRNTPMVAIGTDCYNGAVTGDVAATIGTPGSSVNASGPTVMQGVSAPTITATNDPSRLPQSAEITQQVAAVHASTMTVRRLTPRECERLQAFPDDWTLIPWRGKPADQCPDGPRYKALGNSMAVNCMAWIGERIASHEARTQVD